MTPLNDGPPFGPVVNGTMVVVFWEYRPSNIAAYLFLSLFALATLGHLVYFVWLRSWTFIPLLLGGICEATSSLTSCQLIISPLNQVRFSDTLNAPAPTSTRQLSTLGCCRTCSSSSPRLSSPLLCTCHMAVSPPHS